jgi:hypothetical protein
VASQYSFENDQTAVRDLANQWLARFAPLISAEQPPFEEAVIRHQIRSVSSLRSDGPEILRLLESLPSESDRQLFATIAEAVDQLESIEKPLRKQLAKVAPGDPLGIVDVESLQDRLAERHAKQEIGISDTNLVPAILEIETSPPNVAAALGAGIFGLAWTGFTTFHCIFMIGGMYKSMGILAFAMLLFYSIFFLVGYAMLAAAANSLGTESIELNGRTLTIRKTLRGWVRTKSHQLSPETHATIGKPQSGVQGSTDSAPLQAINFTDLKGKGISVGASTTYEYKEKLVKKINEYLAAWG